MKKIVIAVPLAFMLVGCSSTFELIDEKDVKETEAIPSTTSFKMSASEEVAGIIFSINEFILTSDTTEVNLEIENTTSATPAAWNAEEMSISINGKQLNAIDFQGVGGKIEAGNYQEGKVVFDLIEIAEGDDIIYNFGEVDIQGTFGSSLDDKLTLEEKAPAAD